MRQVPEFKSTKMNQLPNEIRFIILSFINFESIGVVMTINQYMYKLFFDSTRLKVIPATIEEMISICKEQKLPAHQLKTIDLTLMNKSKLPPFGNLTSILTQNKAYPIFGNTFSIMETLFRQCKTVETIIIDNNTYNNHRILAEFVNQCCFNLKKVIIHNCERPCILRSNITRGTIISNFSSSAITENEGVLDFNCKYLDVFPYQFEISCSNDWRKYSFSNIEFNDIDSINALCQSSGLYNSYINKLVAQKIRHENWQEEFDFSVQKNENFVLCDYVIMFLISQENNIRSFSNVVNAMIKLNNSNHLMSSNNFHELFSLENSRLILLKSNLLVAIRAGISFEHINYSDNNASTKSVGWMLENHFQLPCLHTVMTNFVYKEDIRNIIIKEYIFRGRLDEIENHILRDVAEFFSENTYQENVTIFVPHILAWKQIFQIRSASWTNIMHSLISWRNIQWVTFFANACRECEFIKNMDTEVFAIGRGLVSLVDNVILGLVSMPTFLKYVTCEHIEYFNLMSTENQAQQLLNIINH